MESKAFNIDVNAKAQSQNPLLGLLSTVVINKTRQFEEFTMQDGRRESLGFFPASSFCSPPYPQIFVKLENFKPKYVYQVLYGQLHDHYGQLHDHVLSQKISDELVVEAQRKMSQGFKQPLFIQVFVKLTHKVSNLVPYSSAPPTTESELEKTCAICLENMSEGSEDYDQMPNCSHWFHEKCVLEWLYRYNNSCPLCRQTILEELEEESDEEEESEEEAESDEEAESEGEV